MKSKPTILVMTGYYLPGFKSGGPIRSIVNTVDSLHSDFNFKILAADRDLGDTSPYAGIPTNEWLEVGNAQVKYLAPDQRSMRSIWNEIAHSQAELLYLNSFFGSWFSVFPLLGMRIGKVNKMPVLLAPRGEFSRGAVTLKARKKRAYIMAAKKLGLLSNVSWHASSLFEKEDIIRETGVDSSDIYVASVLAAPVPIKLPPGERDSDECLNVLFLSRISPMKNLDFALDVLRLVSSKVVFNIYGPIEDQSYWSLCKQKIASLPENVRVRYHGPVKPETVREIMRDNDLFFLPTRGENFGHVIAEALSVGTRVLISDQTPWRNLSESGMGDDLPLIDCTAFVERIRFLSCQTPEQRMRDRVARHRAFEVTSSEKPDKAQNKIMFNATLRSAERTELEA